LPDIGSLTLRTKLQNYYLVLSVAVAALRADLAPRASHFGPLDARVDGKRDAAVSVGID